MYQIAFAKSTEFHQLSCLQGRILTSYSTLCDVFGPPHSDGDQYKTQAEWRLVFSDGTRAAIYDYKEGDCYHGAGCGITKEAVTDWHVGGYCKEAVKHVETAIINYLDRVCTSATPAITT